MDAFTVLAEMAGGIDLTPDQVAQLRALNVRYYTALFRLQSGAGGESGVDARQSGDAGTRGGRDELHTTLRADVHAVLTPAQRRTVGGG